MTETSTADIVHLDHVNISAEPWHWEFATVRRLEIDEYFAGLIAERPAVWNGRVLLLKACSIRGGALVGSCFETDYASFIAWHHWNRPDPSVFNFFTVAAVRAVDQGYLVGEMAPYTAGAGRLYFPGGTPDPSDIDARGAFDPINHLSRELREETGIGIDELDAEPAWTLVRDGCSIALIRRLSSRESSNVLCRRAMRHIKGEQQPEFSDIRIVRGPSELDARMPNFMQAFLHEQWKRP